MNLYKNNFLYNHKSIVTKEFKVRKSLRLGEFSGNNFLSLFALPFLQKSLKAEKRFPVTGGFNAAGYQSLFVFDVNSCSIDRSISFTSRWRSSLRVGETLLFSRWRVFCGVNLNHVRTDYHSYLFPIGLSYIYSSSSPSALLSYPS